MNNKIKTILFAGLIAAMILPFSGMDFAEAEKDKQLVKKKVEPKEFTGDYKIKTKKIGSYLLTTYTYSSDELTHLGVDYLVREEIQPISAELTSEDIDKTTKTPKETKFHKMKFVHGDDVDTFDKIQDGDAEYSAQVFQKWDIVKSKSNDKPKKVNYRLVSHVEDWASKNSGSAYHSYDPINLIWSDTASSGGSLLSKVNTEMSNSGWNDWCVHSNDLYINISGTWTKQDEHYIDQNGFFPCDQFHVRAWEINYNSVIGSAHEEDPKSSIWTDIIDIEHISTSGPNYTEYDTLPNGGFYHGLVGFDSSEDEATGEFTGGCWSSSKDSHSMGNEYTRKYIRNGNLESTAYNDGYATVINCS